VGALPALKPPGVNDSYEQVMADVPGLGQHTDAILATLGYSAQQVAALRAAQAI
jgi:itaconate CoA-transferase